MATKDASGPIAVSRSRKFAAASIRWLGFLLGAGIAALYELLVCTGPPDDWQHMRPKTFMLMYVGGPVLIAFGVFWLFDRIAARIDKRSVARELLR